MRSTVWVFGLLFVFILAGVAVNVVEPPREEKRVEEGVPPLPAKRPALDEEKPWWSILD